MRRLSLVLVLAFQTGACAAPDDRSAQMRRWLSQSKPGCKATASVLKKLRRGVGAFEKIYAEEFEKTKQGGRPLQQYNPLFLSRLAEALRLLDTERGPLAKRLVRKVWSSHYRFVKQAPQMVPRLHRLLVRLAELRSTLDVARRLEKRYQQLLMQKSAKQKKSPPSARYWVRIKSDREAKFLTKRPEKIPTPKVSGPLRRCKPYLGTVRTFKSTDEQLYNRVDCRGRDQIVYTAHLYHLMQIKLILAEIKRLDLRGLTIAFRRSAE